VNGELTCRTDMYHGLPGIRYCTYINPKTHFSATVTANGGRIMSLCRGSFDAIDSNPEVIAALPGLLKMERSQVKWEQVNLGGGRCWPAPQNLFGKDGKGEGMVPFLDLDLGEYSLEEADRNTVVLCSPVDRETLLRVARLIRFDPAGTEGTSITDRIANHSRERKLVAPWDLLQVKRPVSITVGPLRERPTVFREFGDPYRVPGLVTEEDKGIWTLALGSGLDIPMFKLGLSFDPAAVNGKIRSLYQNGMLLQHSFPVTEGPYPHKGAAEIFFNSFHQYVELEVLGREQWLAPEEFSQGLSLKVELKQ